MKTYTKMIVVFISGCICGHLFGPRDPLPIHEEVRNAKSMILKYHEKYGKFPEEVQGFGTVSESQLRHDTYEITYDYSEGTLEYIGPWVYSGFLRRLTLGRHGYCLGVRSSKGLNLRYYIKESNNTGAVVNEERSDSNL